MLLSDALEDLIGKRQGGSSPALHGVLGYFEGQEPEQRYICQCERFRRAFGRSTKLRQDARG